MFMYRKEFKACKNVKLTKCMMIGVNVFHKTAAITCTISLSLPLSVCVCRCGLKVTRLFPFSSSFLIIWLLFLRLPLPPFNKRLLHLLLERTHRHHFHFCLKFVSSTNGYMEYSPVVCGI